MSVQRTFPVLPNLDRATQDEFRQLRSNVYDLQDKIQTLNSAAAAAGTAAETLVLYTGVVALAKLTTTGANGSVTVKDGKITAVTPAT